MVKTFGKLPGDEFFEEMDPWLRDWMFVNWWEDQNEEIEVVKNHAYMIGSFIDPAKVEKILGKDNQIQSSEDDFEKSMEMVRNQEIVEDKQVSNKRKRRKLKV